MSMSPSAILTKVDIGKCSPVTQSEGQYFQVPPAKWISGGRQHKLILNFGKLRKNICLYFPRIIFYNLYNFVPIIPT